MPIAMMPRKIRKVGAPLAVIIALGTLTAVLIIGITAVNPAGAVIGFVLTTVTMAVVVGAYLWLDRWEPEPPRLLVLAFLWGASVAVLISIVLEVLAETWINPGATADSGTSPLGIAVGAPIIEEAAKGLFLLIMMTGRRRAELNSLTDCLVYAGLTAAGFAWIEDIFYIASGETVGASLATASMRLVMAPFAHPLFTTFTGIGVYFALQQRNALAKTGCIIAGYLVAVLMHGLWNGSAVISLGTYFGVYVLWMVPIFAMAIWLAVRSRGREQRIVAEKLPGMVEAGLIMPNEASWLVSIRNRKLAIAAARHTDGKAAAAVVRLFGAQVVELAFVRDRIDRGFGDARVHALYDEETQLLRAVRAAAAPTLQRLATYQLPA